MYQKETKKINSMINLFDNFVFFLAQVPEVAGFWLLTLVMQLPLILFLLATNKALPSPLERSVHFVQLTFILFEAVSGYFALRRMTHHQIMKFHLQQFDDIFDIDNGHAVTDGYQPMA